jgi:hypothetical protein
VTRVQAREPFELVAIRAALAERPNSCWERLLDAADELAHVHKVRVDEVIARIELSIAAEGQPNGSRATEEARAFFNQAWPG